MKPLRLILPITLFILSGVLAWVGLFLTKQIPEFIFVASAILFIVFITLTAVSIIWSLGGFDE